MELLDIIIWIVEFLVLIVIIVNIFLYLDYLREAYDCEDLEEEAELLTERYNVVDIEAARHMAKYGEVE